mgnify:CR=1 FL=1
MHTNDTNIRENTNDTNIVSQISFNKESKLIYPELSYLLTGACFDVHNGMGRFGREKQYADSLEEKLIALNVPYKREFRIGGSGNIIDFLVGEKIVLEIKARPALNKEDYYQLQRYLQRIGLKLGMLVNFRSRYLKPIRIIRIETDTRNKFV